MERRMRWTNLVPPLVRAGVRAEVIADGNGELLIYDVIDSWGGYWGVSAAGVAAALSELGPLSTLCVRLNSPGGDYFEGVAIAGMLARNAATVTVCVDGLAASAASVIAMGGDRVVMGQGSQMMIHEASSIAWGTADKMRRAASMLDQTNDDIAALYHQRAGGELDAWREAVRVETWYTAAQAVTAGLADEVAALPARAAPPAPDPAEDPPDGEPPEAGGAESRAAPIETPAPAPAVAGPAPDLAPATGNNEDSWRGQMVRALNRKAS